MARADDTLSLSDFMPEGAADTVAYAGKPLGASPAKVASADDVAAALRTVYDPEIPVNIHDLGLIYKMDIDAKGDVRIDMTLTAPACPVAGILPGQVAKAVAAVEGVGEVEVSLVWDPPWTRERMTDEAKFALDMF
jgi:FeS assembly SUF system protein